MLIMLSTVFAADRDEHHVDADPVTDAGTYWAMSDGDSRERHTQGCYIYLSNDAASVDIGCASPEGTDIVKSADPDATSVIVNYHGKVTERGEEKSLVTLQERRVRFMNGNTVLYSQIASLDNPVVEIEGNPAEDKALKIALDTVQNLGREEEMLSRLTGTYAYAHDGVQPMHFALLLQRMENLIGTALDKLSWNRNYQYAIYPLDPADASYNTRQSLALVRRYASAAYGRDFENGLAVRIVEAGEPVSVVVIEGTGKDIYEVKVAEQDYRPLDEIITADNLKLLYSIR